MSDTRLRPLVLIVEDDPDRADRLQQALGSRYSVECASDVPAALTHFTQDAPPDAVLLNCHLSPKDGVGALLAQADHAGSGVVLLCGDPEMSADLSAFFQYPCLCTPFAPARLLAAVSGVVRGNTARPRMPHDPHARML